MEKLDGRLLEDSPIKFVRTFKPALVFNIASNNHCLNGRKRVNGSSFVLQYVIRHTLFVYIERFGNYTDIKKELLSLLASISANITRHTKLKTNYSCDNDWF